MHKNDRISIVSWSAHVQESHNILPSDLFFSQSGNVCVHLSRGRVRHALTWNTLQLVRCPRQCIIWWKRFFGLRRVFCRCLDRLCEMLWFWKYFRLGVLIWLWNNIIPESLSLIFHLCVKRDLCLPDSHREVSRRDCCCKAVQRKSTTFTFCSLGIIIRKTTIHKAVCL